jgi:hypothetical protein
MTTDSLSVASDMLICAETGDALLEMRVLERQFCPVIFPKASRVRRYRIIYV